MPLEELLQRLVKGVPGNKYFLTAYLDLKPDASGKKTYPVFLKSRLADLAARFPPHSEEYAYFVKDSKQVQKFLEEKLDPSWKGIALFACAPADLFMPVPMPQPPANKLEVTSCPLLFPLLRYSDLYRTYGIVAADSRQARLFLVRLSRVEKQLTLSWEDSHSTRFGRMGLSTQRFQRHQQEHLKKRAKEISENMEKWISLEKAEYLFSAAEEDLSGELGKQWSAATKKRLSDLPGTEPRDPDHKILAAAAALLHAQSREKAEILAHKILEEAAPLGQGTVGPEPTVSALLNHQAERVVLDAQFQASGWTCEKCASVGSGGTPSTCPLCDGRIHSAELSEEIACRAASQGVPLHFTQNFAPILKAGGIAAMLKYKTTSQPRHLRNIR
jgi:rubrerythrin